MSQGNVIHLFFFCAHKVRALPPLPKHFSDSWSWWILWVTPSLSEIECHRLWPSAMSLLSLESMTQGNGNNCFVCKKKKILAVFPERGVFLHISTSGRISWTKSSVCKIIEIYGYKQRQTKVKDIILTIRCASRTKPSVTPCHLFRAIFVSSQTEQTTKPCKCIAAKNTGENYSNTVFPSVKSHICSVVTHFQITLGNPGKDFSYRLLTNEKKARLNEI